MECTAFGVFTVTDRNPLDSDGEMHNVFLRNTVRVMQVAGLSLSLLAYAMKCPSGLRLSCTDQKECMAFFRTKMRVLNKFVRNCEIFFLSASNLNNYHCLSTFDSVFTKELNIHLYF